MMEILGKKRIVVLTILLAVNALLGAAIYLHFMPENQKVNRALVSTKSRIGSVQSDLSRAEQSLNEFSENEDLFTNIRDQQRFFSHNRQEIGQYLASLTSQYRSANVKTLVSLDSRQTTKNEAAEKAGYIIAVSPIEIEIQALDDVSVLSFLHQIQTTFPGYLKLEDFQMTRKFEVTNSILKEITLGENPELVDARINFSWYSMIEQPQEAGG